MNPLFIAIAGGSGAGKSTLAHSFADMHPARASVLHLDDYRKEKEFLPRIGEFINWDHPDTIYWDALVRDLDALKRGDTVTIHKKNERFDNHGLQTDDVSRTVAPSLYIMLDGYLALMNPDVRAFFDFSVFLDLSHEQRIVRRKKFNDVEDGQTYFNTVLIPMHDRFVEPTKQYADIIIDVENISKADVLQTFITYIQERYG
jgi:uridine kinase